MIMNSNAAISVWRILRILVVATLLHICVLPASQAAKDPFSLTVINHVDPCLDIFTNKQWTYTNTIKLFWAGANYPQENVAQGGQMTLQLDFSSWNTHGVGIQENGLYCRSTGDLPDAYNPDNTGRGLTITKAGSCAVDPASQGSWDSYGLPSGDFIIATMSGTWPNCVATLSRNVSASPKCQAYPCPGSHCNTNRYCPPLSSSTSSSSRPSSASSGASGSGHASSSLSSHIASYVVAFIVIASVVLQLCF